MERSRNLPVIYNEDTPLIRFILRQHHRRLVGTAETAADRHIKNLFKLLQRLIPDFHHRSRGWLGRRNIRPGRQLLKKKFAGQCNALIKTLPIDVKRHRQDKNPKFFRLFLADAAVTVCYDSNLLHIGISSFIL